MFAHVSPEDDSFGETISTLKFAQRASTVELGAARSNKESNEVIQLKQQVKVLITVEFSEHTNSIPFFISCYVYFSLQKYTNLRHW